MVEHFDQRAQGLLSADRSAKGEMLVVKVVSNNGRPTVGGGSIDFLMLLALLPLTIRRYATANRI